MTRFEVLSNKAREQYRPPLWVQPVTAELLLKFGFKKNPPKTQRPEQRKQQPPVQRASRLGAANASSAASAPGKPQLTPGQPAKPQPARPSASQAGSGSWQGPAQGSSQKSPQKPAAPSSAGRSQENNTRFQPSQPYNATPGNGRYRSERSGMPPSRRSLFDDADTPVSQNGTASKGAGETTGRPGARSTGSTNPVTRFSTSSGVNGLIPRQNGSGNGVSRDAPKYIPNRPSQPQRDERFSRDPQPNRGQQPRLPDRPHRDPPPYRGPQTNRDEQPRRIPQLPIKPKPELPKVDLRSNTDLDTELPVQIPLAPSEQPRLQEEPQENQNSAPPKREEESFEALSQAQEMNSAPGKTPSAETPKPSDWVEEKPQEKAKMQPAAAQPRAKARPAADALPPAESLERLLESHPGLPNETAVLGVCDDGLPVLLDLNDPTPGSLLLVGDEREKHLDMLRSAVTSTVKRNSPHAIQFLVITDDPKTWDEWIFSQGYERHCLGVEDRESEAARQWILQLADWTEQRRLGQRGGPPVLVLFDTLDFLPRLPYDVRLNFDWMVKEAPPARIWPVASISTNLALSIGSRMLRSFQSRVLGYSCDAAVYTRLGGLEDPNADDFVRPGEFAVKVGDDWLRFQAPRRKI